MVGRRFRVPLSPPNSPRMSDSEKVAGYHSQHAHVLSEYRSYREHANIGQGYQEDVSVHSQDPTKSSLRSYKSFTYSPGPSAGSCHQHDPDLFSHTIPADYQQRKLLHPMISTDFYPATYDASTPESPVDRLTPHSPDTSVKDQHDDDDSIDSAGEDQNDGTEKVEMTPAELRAHKRKMKRFRLTHSQTRFLMSEFARQAHPDAGHRERLAREIPGLSARQVQVWFQNRRAKLKRHTTDDQARMMRSRALPVDFDSTQALHSPFGAQQPQMSAPISSMGTYPAYGEHGSVRPLRLDVVRGVPEYDQYTQSYASPAGASPALAAFGFTPPHSASDHITPAPSTNMPPYHMHQQGAYESSRRGPASLPVAEHGYAPSLHMPHHERISRTSGESNTLRTSISQSGLGSSSGQPHRLPERSSSFSEQSPYSHQFSQPPRSVGVTEFDSYGLGFSYIPIHSYPSGEQQHQPPAIHNTTEPESFRRAPLTLTYSQYSPSSYTSALYQSYAPPYASREAYGCYSQQVQGEPPAHLQRAQSQSCSVPGAPQPFIHTPVTQVTESSGGSRTMPLPY